VIMKNRKGWLSKWGGVNQGAHTVLGGKIQSGLARSLVSDLPKYSGTDVHQSLWTRCQLTEHPTFREALWQHRNLRRNREQCKVNIGRLFPWWTHIAHFCSAQCLFQVRTQPSFQVKKRKKRYCFWTFHRFRVIFQSRWQQDCKNIPLWPQLIP